MPLDINLFRVHAGGDPEIIRESQRRRFASVELVDQIIAKDDEWRKMTGDVDNLRKQRNAVQKEVGAKMKELATSHQVFCITHLPQVAAAAESQFMVSKDTTGERTRTTLVSTVGLERISEIARMLGGQAESARKHAKALLSGK